MVSHRVGEPVTKLVSHRCGEAVTKTVRPRRWRCGRSPSRRWPKRRGIPWKTA